MCQLVLIWSRARPLAGSDFFDSLILCGGKKGFAERLEVVARSFFCFCCFGCKTYIALIKPNFEYYNMLVLVLSQRLAPLRLTNPAKVREQKP